MPLQPAGAVWVRVPATSANLGPGFDSFGLALAKYDTVEIEWGSGGDPVVIDVRGEGADVVPRDASHLVVRSLLAGLDTWAGERPASLRLSCDNQLPHGRGLGSSAAAIVAGLVAARAMLADPHQVGGDDVLGLANRVEGHPDNVAAALAGGFVVSWTDRDRTRSLSLAPDPRVLPVVCIPGWPMSTEQARGLLPADVPHADAAFTAARAALLVAALSEHPELLLEATEDRLHQPYRAAALGPSAELLARLRGAGVPAVVSGAGPSVLALLSVHPQDSAGRAVAATEVSSIAGTDWTVEVLPVDRHGASVEYLDQDTRLDL
ncbi:MAG TPA: homoserine kinase [Nocardioidaceae bacterium]|nr:homoserine kinase [Nocardioidaceae bacterium]